MRRDDSALDGRACLVLDYDRPENPWPLRRLRDELRCAAPGLHVGPALLRRRAGGPALLFFFSVRLPPAPGDGGAS